MTEIVPALLLAIEVLQRLQRADVRVVELQGLLRRGDGVVDVAERRVVPARDLDPQIGRLLGIGDPLHHLGVVADQLVPLVGRGGQALQLLGDTVVRVVLAEGGLQGDEGAVAIVELLLVDLGDLHQQLDARRRVGRELGPRQQEIDQLHPALALAIELLQLERGGLMPRVDLQHTLVDLRRRAAVADLVGPQRGSLHEDVDPLGRVGQRLHAPLQDVDRLLPARLLHEEALERRQRAEVRRVELQDLAPGVDGVLGAHEGVALQLTELREQLLQLVALDPAATQLADLDETAQRLRQLLPGPGAPVVGGDGAQRIDVLRIDLQDLLPALQRVPLARQLLTPDPPQALVDRDPGLAVGGRRHLLLEHLGERGPFTGHLVQIGQAGERDGVLAADVDHPPPQLDGLGAIVERVGGQLGHPRVAIGETHLVAGDLGDLLVDAVELAPALAAEVEPLQRVERLARLRGVLEDGQVAGDRQIPLLQRLGVDLSETQVEGDQLRGVVGGGQPLAEDAGQVLVHPLALVDAIERGQRGGVLFVLVEHRQERLLRALQIPEVALEAGGQTAAARRAGRPADDPPTPPPTWW